MTGTADTSSCALERCRLAVGISSGRAVEDDDDDARATSRASERGAPATDATSRCSRVILCGARSGGRLSHHHRWTDSRSESVTGSESQIWAQRPKRATGSPPPYASRYS